VHGVVPGVPDKLFSDLTGALVGDVPVARAHALLAHCPEQLPEVHVEALGHWGAREGLHLVGVRREVALTSRHDVRRVDRDLALEARDPAKGVRDFRSGHGDQDDVRVRRVPAVVAELVGLVARRPPQVREPSADRCSADRHDLHSASFRGGLPSSSGAAPAAAGGTCVVAAGSGRDGQWPSAWRRRNPSAGRSPAPKPSSEKRRRPVRDEGCRCAWSGRLLTRSPVVDV